MNHPHLAFSVLVAFVLALFALWSPPRRRGGLRIAGGLLSVLVGTLLLASCSALGFGQGSAGDPTPQLVQASRRAHDVIAPRFAAYVEADPLLSPALRSQLMALVGDWRIMIERGEAYVAPGTPAPGLPDAGGHP